MEDVDNPPLWGSRPVFRPQGMWIKTAGVWKPGWKNCSFSLGPAAKPPPETGQASAFRRAGRIQGPAFGEEGRAPAPAASPVFHKCTACGCKGVDKRKGRVFWESLLKPEERFHSFSTAGG